MKVTKSEKSVRNLVSALDKAALEEDIQRCMIATNEPKMLESVVSGL